MELEEITIIITTFKSDKKINSCLDSISRRAKVLIVENSGNKELKDSIERKYTNVQCIISEDNLGYAKANNLGLRKVKTKYALVLNPDSILKSDALENFLKTTLTCKDFSLIGPTTNQGRKVEGKNDLIEVKNLKGFGIFFNMEKFQDNKFFDENYFLYFEEIDLCKNVTINNGKIYLDPKIKIFHEGGSSVDNAYSFEIEKNRNWHWMWSTFYYHKKYYNFFYALIIVFPKLFSAFFKSIFYALTLKKEKRDIYYCRLSGLINSILGKKSWYRPNLN